MNKDMEKLLLNLAYEDITKIRDQYKINDDNKLEQIIIHELVKNKVNLLLDKDLSFHEIKRMKSYKSAIKNSRKKIYYSLRQFFNPEVNDLLNSKYMDYDFSLEKLLKMHISTSERLPYYQFFYDKLFSAIGRITTVLDLGCGLHPLSFPFEKFAAKKYYALDSSKKVIEILQQFKDNEGFKKIIPVQADLLSSNWNQASCFQDIDKDFECDLCFQLKLIPLLKRHQKGNAELNLDVKSKFLVISASLESLTKKNSIAAREKNLLERYISGLTYDVLDYFELPGEAVWILIAG